ncbi:hypothetical protein [Hymenobacter sp. YC55]|uniref:hypothetical protein n=1 Tax=Hymenobacter sp. YC55 TaxID=3034019 RepID=UPI0023F75200|nr:hypothetical protein [Hymenobacter sp. YC55]MDF7815076.1 hypothetical protein [Hymenobacter sp. YC55]
MPTPLAHWIRQQQSLLTTPEDRRRVLAFAQTLTHGTRLLPTPKQQLVLDQFVRGTFSHEELLTHLEVSS